MLFVLWFRLYWTSQHRFWRPKTWMFCRPDVHQSIVDTINLEEIFGIVEPGLHNLVIQKCSDCSVSLTWQKRCIYHRRSYTREDSSPIFAMSKRQRKLCPFGKGGTRHSRIDKSCWVQQKRLWIFRNNSSDLSERSRSPVYCTPSRTPRQERYLKRSSKMINCRASITLLAVKVTQFYRTVRKQDR